MYHWHGSPTSPCCCSREAAHSLKEEESGILSDMTGARRAAKNLGDRIRELDSQAMAQQEHVYAAEFQIQQMERKVRWGMGWEEMGGRP